MKRVLIGLAVLLALGASGWALWTFGPEAVGGPARVDVGGLRIAQLDTVSLRRRIVTASVTGRVVSTDTERDVLVADGTGTISVQVGEDHGLETGATLLAVGRVRQPRRGARILEARAWSEVESALVPAITEPDSARLAPDTTRFGNDQNRSPESSDRSEAAR